MPSPTGWVRRQRKHPRRHRSAGEVDEGLDGIGEQANRTGYLPSDALAQDGGDRGTDRPPGVARQRRGKWFIPAMSVTQLPRTMAMI